MTNKNEMNWLWKSYLIQHGISQQTDHSVSLGCNFHMDGNYSKQIGTKLTSCFTDDSIF